MTTQDTASDSRLGYRNYLLSVLLLILAFNFVDRLVLGLVLQDIKVELGLSDVQLGLLTGLAFALFYSLMGIPIARWADRGNRVVIISATLAVWSVMVGLCGFAMSFSQLLLMRVAVAIGEAGCIPPAHSLIADYFSRAERPRAVARYMLGGPLACVIGYFLAGWMNEVYGWRTLFNILGIPGVVLATVAFVTLREPRQRKARAATAETIDSPAVARVPEAAGVSLSAPGLKEVCVTLARNATFRHLLIAYSVFFFFGYGVSSWQPAFFIRSFGLQTSEVGAWLALIWGAGGLLGTWLGGELAARHAARNERLQLKAMALAQCAFGVITFFVYLASSHYVAFGLLAIAAIGSTATTGPLFATLQTLVPVRMRAMSIAIVYLFANLIGMGLGPLAVGAMSDALQPWVGTESLRYALLIMCPGSCWLAWHLWWASRSVMRDLAEAQRGVWAA